MNRQISKFRITLLPIQLGLALLLYGSAMLTHAQDSDPMWIDVRTASEFSSGHVEGAINIEFGDVVTALGQREVAPDTHIILYCGSGKRSGVALESLRQAGYENLINAGGLDQARDLKAAL